MEVNEPQTMQSVQKLLRFHGLWPKDYGKFNSRFNIVKTRVMLIFYLVTGAGATMHLVHTLATGAAYILPDLIEDCTIICATIGFFYALVVFLTKSPQIFNLMLDLSNFSKFGKPPKFDEINKKMNHFGYFIYIYGTCSVIVYAGVNLYDKPRCDKESEELGLERVCGFMANTWMPFDIQEFPRYQIYYVIQVSTCLLICNTGSITVAFIMGIVEIFLTTVTHFKEQLAKTFTYKNEKDKRRHLKYCIRYHVNIIENAAKINDIVGNIGVMHMTFSSVIISLIAIQFLLKPELSSFMHLCGWLIMLFVPCFAGQRIINESSDIPFEIYSTEWYLQDVDVQKCISFMISRSNRNMSLRAAGFGNLSMATFTAVLQTTYSYVAVLYQSID